ncbi:MAG: NADPH:quinone oxidoreductase family protein [bacterium]|nr:MAG: NADPH:quinone oxidoreductase family protein [bacterium]
MKAAYVKGFGDVDMLQIADVPIQEPGKGEVLVRIKACGLNYADVLQRLGIYPGGPKPPYIPGMEASGVVEAHSAEITKPAIGTPVIMLAQCGMQAEYAVINANFCTPLPDDLSFSEGAAFPVQYLTAYHALTTVANAQPTETVLIHAAGGGFGTAAVQIGKLLGLKVIGTASNNEKRKRILSLGADMAVAYDSFEQACRKLTNQQGPDIIIETVGGNIFRRSLAILPPFGRLIVIGMSSQQIEKIDTAYLLFRSKSVLGFHLNALLTKGNLISSSIMKIFNWIRQGKLRIQVGHTFPLSEIRQAHKLALSRKSFGKIVLIP